MFTNRAKILAGTVVFVITVGGLAYAQYQTDKQVAKLSNQAPAMVTKTVMITPTNVPTATPSAVKVVKPVVKTTTPVVKGVSK